MSKEPNTLNQPAAKPSRSVLFGAAFLMATSAIGPGFLTQTSTFTAQHGAALALIIVMAIIMDITAQMNIWSVVTVSKMRAQDVCNKLLPGLGYVIAILVAIGGLAFNVGNVGGVALGFNAMFGLDQTIGAVVAGCLGIIIFINKNAKTIMDKVATLLAAIILITVLVVAVISQPPLGEVAKGVTRVDYLLNPENNAFTALTTLLGRLHRADHPAGRLLRRLHRLLRRPPAAGRRHLRPRERGPRAQERHPGLRHLRRCPYPAVPGGAGHLHERNSVAG